MNNEIDAKVLEWAYTPNKNASVDTHFLFELVKLIIDGKASKSDVLTAVERIFDKETVSSMHTVLNGASNVYITREASSEGIMNLHPESQVTQRQLPRVSLEVFIPSEAYNLRKTMQKCLRSIKEITDTVEVDTLEQLRGELLSMGHIDGVTISSVTRETESKLEEDTIIDVEFNVGSRDVIIKLTLDYSSVTVASNFKGVTLRYLNPSEYHDIYSVDG